MFKINVTKQCRFPMKLSFMLLIFIGLTAVVRVEAINDWNLAAPISAPQFFGWDAHPTGFSVAYEREEMPSGCEFCDPILVQGIRSGYTGGIYGVDADGNGTRDATLTAELEIVSE